MRVLYYKIRESSEYVIELADVHLYIGSRDLKEMNDIYENALIRSLNYSNLASVTVKCEPTLAFHFIPVNPPCDGTLAGIQTTSPS